MGGGHSVRIPLGIHWHLLHDQVKIKVVFNKRIKNYFLGRFDGVQQLKDCLEPHIEGNDFFCHFLYRAYQNNGSFVCFYTCFKLQFYNKMILFDSTILD